MGRYYFHFRTCTQVFRDVFGTDIAEPADILAHAARLAVDLVTDPTKLCDWGRSAIEVEDEHGTVHAVLSLFNIMALPFGEPAPHATAH